MSRMPGEARSAISDEVVATFNALTAGAAGVGSTSTAVLRWLASGIAIVSPYILAPDSATEGTLISIRTPGSYRAEFMLPQVAATSLLLGIAIGFAAVSPITANPAIGTGGVIATLGPNTQAAAVAQGQYLGIDFTVPDEEANTTRAILRFMATNNAGASPVAGFTAAGAWARVIRRCDIAA